MKTLTQQIETYYNLKEKLNIIYNNNLHKDISTRNDFESLSQDEKVKFFNHRAACMYGSLLLPCNIYAYAYVPENLSDEELAVIIDFHIGHLKYMSYMLLTIIETIKSEDKSKETDTQIFNQCSKYIKDFFDNLGLQFKIDAIDKKEILKNQINQLLTEGITIPEDYLPNLIKSHNNILKLMLKSQFSPLRAFEFIIQLYFTHFKPTEEMNNSNSSPESLAACYENLFNVMYNMQLTLQRSLEPENITALNDYFDGLISKVKNPKHKDFLGFLKCDSQFNLKPEDKEKLKKGKFKEIQAFKTFKETITNIYEEYKVNQQLLPRNPLQPRNLVIDLDIDHTIINSLPQFNNPLLNFSLIDSLKQCGLINVNLFSYTNCTDFVYYIDNLRSPKKQYFTKIDLVEKLNEKGIKVEKVFLGVDLLNKKTPKLHYNGNISWTQMTEYVKDIEKIARLLIELDGKPSSGHSSTLEELTTTIQMAFGNSTQIDEIFTSINKETFSEEDINILPLLQNILKNPSKLSTTNIEISKLNLCFYTFAGKYLVSEEYYKLNYDALTNEPSKEEVMGMRLQFIKSNNYTPITFLFADDNKKYLNPVISKVMNQNIENIDLTGSQAYENDNIAIIPLHVNDYSDVNVAQNKIPYNWPLPQMDKKRFKSTLLHE